MSDPVAGSEVSAALIAIVIAKAYSRAIGLEPIPLDRSSYNSAMGRPSDARSKMIRVGAALFRQRGYDGVGLAEILTASSAPKGSLYHHFPGGKEQLAEEAIRYAGEQVAQLIDQVFESAASFPAGLVALVELLAARFELSGFRDGCPITSVALATVPKSATHASAVREILESWRRRLTNHASRLGVASFTSADAERFLMLIEGGWILARLRQSKAPLLDAVAYFLDNLASADREITPHLDCINQNPET